jgi:hypothetical protein
MLEAASFSLRTLLVFRPRVRGGDGTELSSGSTEPLEGTEAARPAEAEGFGAETRVSLAATESGGVGFGRRSSSGGSSLTAYASGSRASSSFSASKLFLFSRVASAECVAFGAWARGSFRLGCLRRLFTG